MVVSGTNFFFGPLPSLLPFAPLFHIVTPQWRPLVVDPGTNFFLRTSILTPFAPLFHIVTPRWRPLVVDSGTNFFFCRTSILTSFAPLFHIITPRWRPLVVDSGTEFFLAHFHPYSLLQPYFILSRHCCALWWWIPELNHFFRTFPSLFPCHPKFK